MKGTSMHRVYLLLSLAFTSACSHTTSRPAHGGPQPPADAPQIAPQDPDGKPSSAPAPLPTSPSIPPATTRPGPDAKLPAIDGAALRQAVISRLEALGYGAALEARLCAREPTILTVLASIPETGSAKETTLRSLQRQIFDLTTDGQWCIKPSVTD